MTTDNENDINNPEVFSKRWAGVALLECIILGFFVVKVMINRFISFKNTPIFAYTTIFLGYFLSASIVFLIPIDISNTTYRECITSSNSAAGSCTKPFFYIPQREFTLLWKGIYWTTVALCWVIYPILQGYASSGQFTFREKLRSSVQSNLRFYAVCGAVGAVFLVVYVARTKSLNPFPVIMALSNTWGLLVLMGFVGLGIVNVPRKIRFESSYESLMYYYHYSISKAESSYKAAREGYLRVLSRVKDFDAAIRSTDSVHRPLIDTVIAKCDPELYAAAKPGLKTPDVYYNALVALHYDVMTHSHNYSVEQDIYQECVRKGLAVRDVSESRGRAGDRSVRWTAKRQHSSKAMVTLEWVWYVLLRERTMRVLSWVLAALSFAILWSETLFSVDRPVLSILALAISPAAVRSSDFALSAAIFVPLAYMVFCTFWSMFRMKVFKVYRLIPNQKTDLCSILFSASYVVQSSAPLALNFFHMLKFRGSAFQETMGAMERTPILGDALFNNYAPLCLLAICGFALFGIGERCLRCLRISYISYDDSINKTEANAKEVERGKSLLDAESRGWLSGVRLIRASDLSSIV